MDYNVALDDVPKGENGGQGKMGPPHDARSGGAGTGEIPPARRLPEG